MIYLVCLAIYLLVGFAIAPSTKTLEGIYNEIIKEESPQTQITIESVGGINYVKYSFWLLWVLFWPYYLLEVAFLMARNYFKPR